MYSLPSHLSQSSRELILRMLVVDPIKRITMAEVRQHPWYQHKLPAYLTLPPALIEMQERYVDQDIVEKVCMLPIRGITADIVTDAIQTADTGSNSNKLPVNQQKHELKVTYELLLDEKRHKKRIEDVVLALQDSSATPPTNSPRILGLGTSPSSSLGWKQIFCLPCIAITNQCRLITINTYYLKIMVTKVIFLVLLLPSTFYLFAVNVVC